MVHDGLSVFRPAPHNRWTCFESPNASDWLEIDFGGEREVGRLELHIYDDRGGVRAPASYTVQRWDGVEWKDVESPVKSPASPRGGVVNTVTFRKVRAAKIRVVFIHDGRSRTGLTEIEAWEE
jgi:hypothetical protein